METVVLSVTVRDRTNHLVTTLERDEFRLLVDGRPVKVEVFAQERRPLMLGILLSTSVESGVPRMREVGRALVDAIEPGEHAAIGTYATKSRSAPSRPRIARSSIESSMRRYGQGSAMR